MLPRIALPCKDTRDGVVVVRERTVRALFVATRDTTFDAVRDTTLRPEGVLITVPAPAFVATRDVAVLLVGLAETVFVVVVRDVTGVVAVRATVPREETLREEVVALVLVFPRDTVFVELSRDVTGRDDLALALPARVACGPEIIFCAVGAIGSANTARIDKKVEQTKKAPASNNTVPIASLQ